MRKILILASMSVLVLMFALTAFATDPGPNWNDIGGILPGPGQPRPGNVAITEDLLGYPTSTDAGSPYAIGYVGGTSSTYCNTDRDIVFYNWVSVAQWMRIVATDINRHITIRKPGIYTLTSRPMQVRIASNGDVLVTFQQLYGQTWDAAWYEYTYNPGGNPPSPYDKTYPALANELTPQIQIDKKYMIETIGNVDEVPPTGWVDVPAGDGEIKFLNSQDLHELNNPVNGFNMQFQEIVAPCATTGDFVMKARMVFQCFNQIWYINPLTGAIDGTRDASAVPPAPYPAP
ncbi:MAG: hypothetical protein PHW31_03015 [Candidatus Pacebacteria bacterium]|nr:hypothetical protein [Candidatus Paceibacterota bacterium]